MSLRDQLLKSGVASKKQHQAAKSNKKKSKKQNKAKGGVASNTEQKIQQEIVTQRIERKEKDKVRNAEIEKGRAEKALHAQVYQLIEKGKLARVKGDVGYHFKSNNAIKKWYLSALQVEQLAVGRLAIALFDNEFFLIDCDTAKEVEERGKDFIVVWHRASKDKKAQEEVISKESGSLAEEDPYAAYKIPDDLDW